MDEKLSYEEPPTLPQRRWLCEHDGCTNVATVAWKYWDEDGDAYASDRCPKHPVTDPDFTPHEL